MKRVRFVDDAAHETAAREAEAPCEMVPLCLLEAAESHSRGLQAKLERLHDDLTRAQDCIDALQSRLQLPPCACCDDPATRTLDCCGAGLCASCYDDLDCGTLTCPTCFTVHGKVLPPAKVLPPVAPESTACAVRTTSFHRIGRVSVW